MATHIVEHPLVEHLLATLRDRTTTVGDFRQACRAITLHLVHEATRGLPTEPVEIATPLETAPCRRLRQPIVLVPVLRAGLGMLEPAMELLPGATVGTIGLERDEATAEARCYYEKMPDLNQRAVMVLDPMLATGGSAAQTLQRLSGRGAASLVIVSIVAAPEGIAFLESLFPDLLITVASVDRKLDEHKYIRPGLGDFGDRLFGTA